MAEKFFERSEGKGSVDRPVTTESCNACGEDGDVRYIGTDLLDGHLESYHVVHTEVDDHYRCACCGASWTWHHYL